MQHAHEIETLILLRNNSPLEEFLNLTLNQMHSLLYETFTPGCPLQLANEVDDATLDQIPLFRIAESLLKIIEREKQIKLTPLGALPKKALVEIYEQKFLLDELIEEGIYKLWREEDCISILSARVAVMNTGLVKKVNGRLTLTRKGIKLLKTGERLQIFHHFLESFTTKFLWAFNDGYSEPHAGQLGWAFSILLLHKFGAEERFIKFYAEKYLQAFPEFISSYSNRYHSAEVEFSRCYSVRVFEGFLCWFGFAKIKGEEEFFDREKNKVTRTDLVEKIFKFDIE